MMQTIQLETLATVTGGASKSSEVTQSLSAIQSSISDLKNTNNNSSNNGLLLPVMMMAMNRQKSSGAVVATPGATVVTQ